MLTWLLVLSSTFTHAQLVVTEIKSKQQVESLVRKHLLGDGVKITRISYKGNTEAIGAFKDHSNTIGIKSGVILSTGRVAASPGPNNRKNTGANFGDHFFFDESLITKASQCDGVVLEIDFVPENDSLSFAFQFGSEEYPEFVGKEFNDMFLFELQPLFIRAKAKNLALLPNKKLVSINNVNSTSNQDLYIDNTNINAPLYQNLEWDGITKPLYTGARVAAGKPYRLKIILADLEDCEYDSGVLLEAYSLRSLSTKPKIFSAIKRTYSFQFDNGKASIKTEQLKKLKLLSDSLQRFNFDSIEVIGHTDDNGDASANQLLSEQRAQTIVTYLMEQQIKCITYKATGKGSSEPIQPNTTNTNKAANRRVELIFYRKAK